MPSTADAVWNSVVVILLLYHTLSVFATLGWSFLATLRLSFFV
jgi:hypothetical protein